MSGGVPGRGARSPHVKLAKNAAEYFVKHHTFLPLPTTLTAELWQQRACFVSIFENPGHRLRATYGQPLPRQSSLAEEIIINASWAVKEHIRRNDLAYLSYAVAVVEKLERITAPEHLDPLHYGLYVRSDQGKTAVLLPHRLGVETPEDQIATALRESGIDERQEAITLYRFHVTHHE